MELDKIQLIGYFAILVIIVSLASMGLKLTGYAATTDTGIVNVTISASAGINFTTDLVNFGTGSVTLGQTSATVDTEGLLTGGTGWDPANNFTLENIGNTNVSLGLKNDKFAATFIGGTNSSFKYKVINDTEIGSCVGGNASSYTEFSTSDALVCSTFPFADDKDEITIAIRLVIPSDSLSGAQGAVITATGTYS